MKFMAGEPMKPATKRLSGLRVELLRRADLLDHALAHHRDPVAQGHGLGLVVGDVDGGGAQALLQPREISVRICTRSLASRFDSGSSIRNAAGSRTMARPMATRWRWPPDRLAGLRSRCSVRSRIAGGLVDLLVDDGLGRLGQLEGERHVLPHGHVRVEGVALEHHGDVAVLRAPCR